jgi:hypothetical protein
MGGIRQQWHLNGRGGFAAPLMPVVTFFQSKIFNPYYCQITTLCKKEFFGEVAKASQKRKVLPQSFV